MNKLYEAVNANKLVDELQAAGLLERESMSFFPKENGLEIRFRDVKEISNDVLNENDEVIDTVVNYKKRVTEEITETVDDVEVTKTNEVWNEYDPTQLFSDIQAVVDNHDPLKGILDSQIEIIKEECEAKILGGFESDCLGETKVFSSSMNNQATIQGLVLTAIMNMSGFVDEVLEHKAIDEIDCYPWKNEQIIQLGVDLKSHITACKKEAEEKINKLISAK